MSSSYFSANGATAGDEGQKSAYFGVGGTTGGAGVPKVGVPASSAGNSCYYSAPDTADAGGKSAYFTVGGAPAQGQNK